MKICYIIASIFYDDNMMMYFKKYFKLTLITIVLGVTGCSSVLDSPSQLENSQTISHNNPLWQSHLTQLKQIKSYQTSGQFGYISAQPKERFSSSFEWSYQNKQNFDFMLSSALSSQFLKLHHDARGLTISDNKHTRTNDEASLLLERTLGSSFPLAQLGDWLKGIPAENSDYKVNTKGQLMQFNYEVKGKMWQVRYLQYDETKQPNLPKLIALDNGNQILKIRLDKWKY